MALTLEQLSNENLVNFYKEELKMIDLGESASTFFSRDTIRGLLKKGIFKRSLKLSPVHARARWILTISDMTKTLISQTGQYLSDRDVLR